VSVGVVEFFEMVDVDDGDSVLLVKREQDSLKARRPRMPVSSSW